MAIILCFVANSKNFFDENVEGLIIIGSFWTVGQ